MASPTQERNLIGLCDGQLDEYKFRPTFLTNKVGGRPNWLPVISPPSPRCRHCRAPLVLVVQVYCPLDASPYHRNLHLFACPGAECSSRSDCWTVLRSQCLEAEARTDSGPKQPQEVPLSATDWCDDADEWGEEADGFGAGVEEEEGGLFRVRTHLKVNIGRQLQQLHLEEAPDTVSILCSLFISVVDESDLGGEDEELRHAQQLLREYEHKEGAMMAELEGGGGASEEKYEKTRARHGDAVFSRFMKKISLCPQQILRYCRGGCPLFISEPPCNVEQMVSACGTCGASRTFELQLMPALVSLLQTRGGSGGQVEFGTILVYTCRNSCWTAGSKSALEEECLVQCDPDHDLFR
uniref:Programmed cell death 2-like n=1 Tax=Takifugu rubripes TaxID=31033 RepID=H2UK71_TAKRU